MIKAPDRAEISRQVSRALAEDIGAGDLTTVSIVPPDAKVRAKFIAKERLVVAGMQVAREVFRVLDRGSKFKILVHDGAPAKPGEIG